MPLVAPINPLNGRKVRSYLLHRTLAFEWRRQAPDKGDEEFEAHAKLPLIPLLILPDGTGYQDSTSIILSVERFLGLTHSGVLSVLPAQPVMRMLSFLLEEVRAVVAAAADKRAVCESHNEDIASVGPANAFSRSPFHTPLEGVSQPFKLL